MREVGIGNAKDKDFNLHVQHFMCLSTLENLMSLFQRLHTVLIFDLALINVKQ